MRKLLTLVFLLSFALSAQAQFPSWGRQYRPFYGKMRFMDTVAFYVRGTARPDFLLQSIDSFGRMRWVDPDSLGISGGGSSGGNGIFSISNEGDTVRIERAYLRDSLIIDAQDNVVLFDSINAVDGFIIQASGYTGGAGSEARIRMSDRRLWFEQGSPQFVIDALDPPGSLVGGALSFYRQGSLRHYWQLERNNNLSYNGVGSVLGGSDSTKLNFTGAFGARGFGLHIGFSPFSQQPSYLTLETRGRQLSGTIYQGVLFSPMDSVERSRVGWILINSGAATAGTNADTLIDVGKGFRTDSIVSKGDLIVNTTTGGIGYIDSIYTGNDTLLITGTTFSSGNGWQVYKVYGAYNTTQANLAPGTLVYYEPDSCYTFYNGTAWVSMCETSSGSHHHGGVEASTYAALSADSSDVVAVSISTTGAWTNVANVDTTYRNGDLTYAPAAASITVGSAGRYRVSLSASGAGGANNHYELSVFNNGSELGFGSRLSMFSGTSSAPAGDGMSTIVELAANDVLTMRIRNNTGTANWQFYSLAFTVEKL